MCLSISSWMGSPCLICRRSSCSVKILQNRAASVRMRTAALDVWCAAAQAGQQNALVICQKCLSWMISVLFVAANWSRFVFWFGNRKGKMIYLLIYVLIYLCIFFYWFLYLWMVLVNGLSFCLYILCSCDVFFFFLF